MNLILLFTKDIPPRLSGILAFNWHYYFRSVHFEYSTASCVSYPSSTRTLIYAVVNPRVTSSVLVETLVITGVDTCSELLLACETPYPCTTVQTCGAYFGGLCYASGDSYPDADITCKLNRCKQSYFIVLSSASPGYGCIFRLPVSPSTGCN